MEMVLNPEELGKVFMEVTAKDGAVKAKLLAQNETVKAALETQLVILQDRFKEAGMKVDSVEISVGTHEFREGQEESAALDMNMGNSESNGKSQEEMQESKPRLHRIDLNNMDNLMGLMTDEEVLAAQIMKQQGNTISFQA
jgi:flagellar hook-length control protein FliK